MQNKTGLRLEGVDDFQRNLDQLNEEVAELREGGDTEVPIEDLFTREFISKHTDFDSLEEMCKAAMIESLG